MPEQQRTLTRKCEVKRPLGRCVNRRIISKWIFKTQKMKEWTELMSVASGWVLMASTCEHDNEPSGSINSREFLYRLSDLSASEEWIYSIELFNMLPLGLPWYFYRYRTHYDLGIRDWLVQKVPCELRSVLQFKTMGMWTRLHN